MRGFDDDMRDALCESMKQRGLEVLLGCEFTKVEKRGSCLRAETNKGAVIECDQIMITIMFLLSALGPLRRTPR